MKPSQLILEFISGLFILLWLYAAITKIASLESFHKGLSHFPIIKAFAWIMAIGVPLSEIIATILLLNPKTRRIDLILSVLLMSIFSLYILYIIALEPKKPCSCGGILQQLGWTEHLVLNITFITLGVVGIKIYNRIKYNLNYN